MKLGIAVAASALLLSPLLAAAPAGAVDTPPAPEVLTQELTLGMTPEGTDTPGVILMAPADGPFLNSKGSGGASRASGCARFFVNNVEKNLLGSKAFEVRVWTDACWNRAKKIVTVNATGQTIRYIGSTWDYGGIVSTDRHFYSWAAGAPRSGYHHYRMLKFANCVVKYGCIGNNYSRQTIRVRSNGTYTWQTDGDT